LKNLIFSGGQATKVFASCSPAISKLLGVTKDEKEF
jgi:hypothetical protein